MTKAFKKLEKAFEQEINPSAELVSAVQEAGNKNSEVYCEVRYTPSQSADANLVWKIKNPKGCDWPEGIRLIPLLHNPSNVKMYFESRICPLQANKTGDLHVSLQIPEGYIKEDYFVCLFKLKTKTR